MKNMKKRKVEGIIFIFTSFCFIMVGILMLIERIQICSMNINLKNGVSFYSDSDGTSDGDYDIAQLIPIMDNDSLYVNNDDDILVYYNGISTSDTDSRYMALSKEYKPQRQNKYIAKVDENTQENLENNKVRNSKFASNYVFEEDVDVKQPEQEKTEQPISTNVIANSATEPSRKIVTYSSTYAYKKQAKPITKWREHKKYSVGDKVIYNGRTYSCLQKHDSLGTWEPDIVPALWKEN